MWDKQSVGRHIQSSRHCTALTRRKNQRLCATDRRTFEMQQGWKWSKFPKTKQSVWMIASQKLYTARQLLTNFNSLKLPRYAKYWSYLVGPSLKQIRQTQNTLEFLDYTGKSAPSSMLYTLAVFILNCIYRSSNWKVYLLLTSVDIAPVCFKVWIWSLISLLKILENGMRENRKFFLPFCQNLVVFLSVDTLYYHDKSIKTKISVQFELASAVSMHVSVVLVITPQISLF